MIVVSLWIVRILVLLLVLRLIVRAFSSRRPAAVGQGPRRRQVERTGGQLVRDPQCGTYIPLARAIAVGRGADVRYFCSRECQERYERRV